MPADLIVYALIAAGLVFWLRSILGTRHGDERERGMPLQEVKSDTGADHAYMAEDRPLSQADKIADLSKNKGVMSVDNEAAEKGLIEISKADKAFDIETFLEAAQDAFAIVVEAFADADRETLEDLLAPSVYAAFDGAINDREARDEKQKSDIHAIRKAEIVDAQYKDKMVYITVRFTADETSVMYDKDDKIIAGHPDKISAMKDIWVFGREARARDPRWFVFETKGDFEGDNELIPNSD